MSIKSIEEASCCCIHNGLFMPMVRCMAERFGHVYTWTPGDMTRPNIWNMAIGDGFSNIERVKSIWEAKRKGCDVFVFLDIGYAEEQGELVREGFPVWGGRGSEELETDRGLFLDALVEAGLPVPSYRVIVGMEKLRQHLRERRDKWIKISQFRDSWETMRWRSWERDGDELEVRSIRLGPMREAISFYVFDEIETRIEGGVDTWRIEGQWPKRVMQGMERKDSNYLATFASVEELPGEIWGVNEKIGPILDRYGCRGAISTEVRVVEKKGGLVGYFLDLTDRFGSPPQELQTVMIGNMAEIVYRGANGECVEPEEVYEFGVQAMVSAKGDKGLWTTIPIVGDLDPWFKPHFCCEYDGALHIPPNPDQKDDDVGYLTGCGDSIKAAIESLQENITMLPEGFCCEIHGLADLLKEADDAEEKGMPFTEEEVPPPESVLEDV